MDLINELSNDILIAYLVERDRFDHTDSGRANIRELIANVRSSLNFSPPAGPDQRPSLGDNSGTENRIVQR